MSRDKSLIIVNDNFLNRMIRRLKKMFGVKEKTIVEKNRKANVIESVRIEYNIKKSITYGDLQQIEIEIENDESYISNLSHEEMILVNDYYDSRILELQDLLKERKSTYFSALSKVKAK